MIVPAPVQAAMIAALSDDAHAAECGILVGPGSTYGPAGHAYIHRALTATDERVAAAGTRLAAL